jgi:hypothetical protein
MKKHLQTIQKSLNKEVNINHILSLTILPVFLYGLFYAYTLAVSTDFNPNTDVHTRIVYYDGNFSQELAMDTIDTSIYVVNQSTDTVKALVYEYNSTENNTNTATLVNIDSYQDKLLTTLMPSLVILTNLSGTSTSTILVGENNRIDNNRLAFLEKSIYSQINSKNINSIKYALFNLKKLYKIDVNVKNNCTKISNEIAKMAVTNFTYLVAKSVNDNFCNNAYNLAIKNLEPKLIDTKNNIMRSGNSIEITLPNEIISTTTIKSTTKPKI